MRTLVCRALLLVVGAVALPTIAVAYPITVTISTVASGTLGSIPFSNATVTMQAFFSTELTGCIICTYYDGFNDIDSIHGLRATVTVSGLGTYADFSNVVADVQPGHLGLDDVDGHLGLNVESPAITATNFFTPSFGPITGSISETELGPDCPPVGFDFCPIYIATTAGKLVLTSVADTATGEVEADMAVPEPGTLGMVVTGVLGMSGFLRRRLGRRG